MRTKLDQATVYLAEYNRSRWLELKARYPGAADSKLLNMALKEWLPRALRYGLDANCEIMDKDTF